MKPVLSAKQIRKSFNSPKLIEILKGVSLDLYPGESIAIMGASGEGKSTLLQILGTLDKPTSGNLIIAGEKASGLSSPLLRNKHIGFVFQNFNLLEDYTVLQNILMPALIAGHDIGPRSSAYQRAMELLQKVGLEKMAGHASKHLSGGEKQRVSLARALCNDPEIILADEPSGNLDHATSHRIHSLLMEAVKDLNKSLIVVTHDDELAELCDRKYRLQSGLLTE